MNDLYPNLFKNLTRSPITIILLDNRKQTMVYDKTTKLSSLFEATCDLCYVDCDNLFGFAILMDDYYAFLDLDSKVCKLNFKEFAKKSQSNILFKPWGANISPIHQSLDENRRHSQILNIHRNNHKLQNSTTSTKSAPVFQQKSNFIPNEDDTPVIYFRVKSYVHTYCLRDRMTKMLYFQQLMRNVLDYKLQCADEIYLQLGAYAIQAFYGDYELLLSSTNDDKTSMSSTNTESSATYSPTLVKLCRSSDRYQNFTRDMVQSGRYFEPKKFFPSWIITKYSSEYLYKEISQLHKSLTGLSRFDAEFSYIRMASAQYSNFNMHLFPVRDQTLTGHSGTGTFPAFANNGKSNGIKTTKNKLWLGLGPAGLEMHEMKNSDFLIHLSTLKWSDIVEVTQKPYRINVRVGGRNLKLHTNTKMQADHLFWLTRHMHIYQTKAKLNAICTPEALDTVERQKYRENYVYMDLEDLKQNGFQFVDKNENNPDNMFTEEIVRYSIPKSMPVVNTPAVPPRRNPSKARPLKMKDLMKISNPPKDFATENLQTKSDINKKPQYIKKTNPSNQSNSYTAAIQKGIKSPEIIVKDHIEVPQGLISRGFKENYIERQSFQSDIDSDQNTSKAYETMDESDFASSLNESECRSPGQFGLKHAGRFISLSQEINHFDEFPSELNSLKDLLPPKQFRESAPLTTHITKSISFDNHDISLQKQSGISQRKLSEPLVFNANLCRSLPMIMGLCHEFNDSKLIDDIRQTKLPNALEEHRSKTSSVGMKSWKSDILFNLNNCLDDSDHDVNNNDNDEDDQENSVVINNSISSVDIVPPQFESQSVRRNSLPQCPSSYRDIISSSSTIDTANDDDSVDISSLSSFDFDYINYTRINKSNNSKGQNHHVAII